MIRPQRVECIIRALRRQRLTVQEIADMFTVSVDTVRRDLQLIQTEPWYCDVQRYADWGIPPPIKDA
jgi:DeoR/GlpR family transcriptional regulator of sugar metabolism